MNPALLAILPWWPTYHDLVMSSVSGEVNAFSGHAIAERADLQPSHSLPVRQYYRVWSNRYAHHPVSRREWMATMVNLHLPPRYSGGYSATITMRLDVVSRIQHSSVEEDDE